MPHISIAAETLFHIGPVGITNSFLTTYIVMAVLFLGSIAVTKKMSLIPNYGQLIAEIIIGGLYDFFATVVGKQVKVYFPLIASIFLFIITSNWLGLLPGVGSIHLKVEEPEALSGIVYASETDVSSEDILQVVPPVVGEAARENEVHTTTAPLFRAPTADLNTTIALALISVIAIQYFGFRESGLHYTSRFVDISNPINFFVGILELVQEFSKIISFAFRLFGNTFAGEVLLVIISALIQIPLLLPLPIIGLELFVGFIQALVFSMLTAVFINVAVTHGHETSGEEVSGHG